MPAAKTTKTAAKTARKATPAKKAAAKPAVVKARLTDDELRARLVAARKANPDAKSWGALRVAAGLPDGRRPRAMFVELAAAKPARKRAARKSS